MKRVDRIKDEAFQAETAKMIKIGNLAVQAAKEENKKFGIPEYVYKNGRIYYLDKSGNLIPKA